MPKLDSEFLHQNDAYTQIAKLAKEYRASWNLQLCESVDIDAYGYNEFLGGKAEGLEEALAILEQSYSCLGENM
jgi:hypothetical protein